MNAPANPWGPYTPRRMQAEAFPRVLASLQAGGRPVVAATMGSGKSVLIGALANAMLDPNHAVVITAPIERLVRQLSATVGQICGEEHVGQFYGKRKEPHKRVVVACNPSLAGLTEALAARGRRCGLLVVDECHRSECASVRDVVPDLRPEALVGFTATPYRSCKTEALSLYTDLVYRYTWADGRKDGVLVPRVDLWDDKADEHADLNAQCLHLIRTKRCLTCGKTALEHGPGIVSARDIADAEAFASWLRAHGLAAGAIHSKMSADDQDDAIRRLRTGALQILVHVSMLSEGVDFPWLQWLCLRRPVGSRNRLVQEVGRIGRVHPESGKDHSLCIDPNFLIHTHGLMHEAAIGEALEAAAAEEERRASDPTKGKPKIAALPPGPTVELATQWATRLFLTMQEEGLAPMSQVAVGPWCTRRPSERQIKRLVSLGRYWARYLPDEFRGLVLALSRENVARKLQRGAVSNLIDVLQAVVNAAPRGNYKRRLRWRYPWPRGLEVPELDPAAAKGLRQQKALAAFQPVFDGELFGGAW